NATANVIEVLFGQGSVTGMSDRQLLERFISERDAAAECAFEALIQRHGPMVLWVCKAALGDVHDAEDAFQATFLVLARRASDVRSPERLGGWLHGVALRSAQKVKARRSRVDRLARRAEAKAEFDAMSRTKSDNRDEEAAMLHDEISRLP